MLVYIFPADNFTISFRTSDKRRAAGFRGYAVCYEPELTDNEGAHSLINTGTKVVTVTKKTHTYTHTHTHNPGCTEAPGDEVNNTETRRRRKRDLEDFVSQYRQLLCVVYLTVSSTTIGGGVCTE